MSFFLQKISISILSNYFSHLIIIQIYLMIYFSAKNLKKYAGRNVRTIFLNMAEPAYRVLRIGHALRNPGLVSILSNNRQVYVVFFHTRFTPSHFLSLSLCICVRTLWSHLKEFRDIGVRAVVQGQSLSLNKL